MKDLGIPLPGSDPERRAAIKADLQGVKEILEWFRTGNEWIRRERDALEAFHG